MTLSRLRLSVGTLGIATLLALVACDGSSTTGGTRAPEDEKSESDPGGPTILKFGANSSVLKSDDEVTFTVVATHPDGVDQLIGGEIVDTELDAASGGVSGTYGALITSAEEGTYTLKVSWKDLNTMKPITFGPLEMGIKSFTVRLFDQQGRKTTESLGLQLKCRQEDEAPLNGVCYERSTFYTKRPAPNESDQARCKAAIVKPGASPGGYFDHVGTQEIVDGGRCFSTLYLSVTHANGVDGESCSSYCSKMTYGRCLNDGAFPGTSSSTTCADPHPASYYLFNGLYISCTCEIANW